MFHPLFQWFPMISNDFQPVECKGASSPAMYCTKCPRWTWLVLFASWHRPTWPLRHRASTIGSSRVWAVEPVAIAAWPKPTASTKRPAVPFWPRLLAAEGCPRNLEAAAIDVLPSPKLLMPRPQGAQCLWRVRQKKPAYCTTSAAQGGGGSFKDRKPIGEVGC